MNKENTPSQALREIAHGKEIARNMGFLFLSFIRFITGRSSARAKKG